jgi:hypothetical protein
MATKKRKTAKAKYTSIRGSKKVPLKGARVVAAAPADERVEVTIRLRPRTKLPSAAAMLKATDGPIQQLTHKQYDALYGADPKDVTQTKNLPKSTICRWCE